MSTPTKPSLEDAAKRNPGIEPARVRKMQEVVKQLQDRGALLPSKYGLEPPLTGPKGALAAAHRTNTLNRVQRSG